jgi:hypothetical protein
VDAMKKRKLFEIVYRGRIVKEFNRDVHWQCKIVLHNHPIKIYQFVMSYQKRGEVGWYGGKHDYFSSTA